MSAEFDVYDLFDKGFYYGKTPKDIYDFCNGYFETKTPGPGDLSTEIEKKILYTAISQSDLFTYFRKVFGRNNISDLECDKVNAYTQIYTLSDFKTDETQSVDCWHNDVDDLSDFIFLFYFNNYDRWKKEYGGQLEFARVCDYSVDDIDEEGIFNPNSINKLKSTAILDPEDGYYVIINNRNPLFLHKVHLTTPGVDRKNITIGITLK